MERTQKYLDRLLLALAFIGGIVALGATLILTALGTDSGSLLKALLVGSSAGLLLLLALVALPLHARKAIQAGRYTPAIAHAIAVMIFMSLLFPINLVLGIWELVLIWRLRQYFAEQRA